MSPVSRLLNIFFSPGKVFEDVRRDPRGWWVPLAIAAAATALFASVYVSRYDIALVTKETLKDSAAMNMVAGIAGPEKRDLALAQAVAQAAATPRWQHMLSQWVNSFVGFSVIAWWFTFLYGLIALLMGWIPDATPSRLWVNLGIVVATGVVAIGIGIGMQTAFAIASKGTSGGTPPAKPAALVIAASILAVGAGCMILWSLFLLSRDQAFGRIVGSVSYGLAPALLSALVGLIVVFLRTPDATSWEDIVPANLTQILNLKETGAVVAALGSSIGIFTIWSILLRIIGLSKTLGRSIGEAAVAVLIPAVLFVLCRTAFAAMFG